MNPAKLIDDLTALCRENGHVFLRKEYAFEHKWIITHRFEYNLYPALLFESLITSMDNITENPWWNLYVCVSTPWGKVKASCRWNYGKGYSDEGKWIDTPEDRRLLFKLSLP